MPAAVQSARGTTLKNTDQKIPVLMELTSLSGSRTKDTDNKHIIKIHS